MADDEFEDLPIPFASEASRPLNEPTQEELNRQRGGDTQCDECGQWFNGAQGVSMHKARIHRGKKWNNKGERKAAKKPAPKPAPKRELQIVLREAWSDKNGRILLTDQDGNWWVAKKLDV